MFRGCCCVQLRLLFQGPLVRERRRRWLALLEFERDEPSQEVEMMSPSTVTATVAMGSALRSDWRPCPRSGPWSCPRLSMPCSSPTRPAAEGADRPTVQSCPSAARAHPFNGGGGGRWWWRRRRTTAPLRRRWLLLPSAEWPRGARSRRSRCSQLAAPVVHRQRRDAARVADEHVVAPVRRFHTRIVVSKAPESSCPCTAASAFTPPCNNSK